MKMTTFNELLWWERQALFSLILTILHNRCCYCLIVRESRLKKVMLLVQVQIKGRAGIWPWARLIQRLCSPMESCHGILSVHRGRESRPHKDQMWKQWFHDLLGCGLWSEVSIWKRLGASRGKQGEISSCSSSGIIRMLWVKPEERPAQDRAVGKVQGGWPTGVWEALKTDHYTRCKRWKEDRRGSCCFSCQANESMWCRLGCVPPKLCWSPNTRYPCIWLPLATAEVSKVRRDHITVGQALHPIS